MKYTPPSAALFRLNRQRFMEKMKPGTAAVFFSNELIPSNADAHYSFEQNSNMYYLSGIDQEDCALFIFPDAPKAEWREILFVRKTNEHIQVWEGWKYSKSEAKEASGVEQVRFMDGFEAAFRQMLPYFEGLYLDFNEHDRQSLKHPEASHQLAEMIQKEFPGHSILRAFPILQDLREVKSEEEIEQMKKACTITSKAFDRVLEIVRPGIWEYEIEAEIQSTFLKNKATGPAYSSIIASGKNACVLHYIQNNNLCREGDLLLMDFGAEYGNYSSDLSRTIPVSGVFTDRQKEVYNACLRVFKGARDMIRTGNTLENLNKETGLLMQEELLRLGLISEEEVRNQDPEKPAFKKYFMHGTSHFLGLDTHDVGDRFAPFREGMVFTCEPGIYIPEENMGIRIENDILVTDAGPFDLMDAIPIEVEEIEDRMAAVKV